LNIFKDVKEAVSVRDAASFYGIDVDRNGMCICPFHNDRNPSMKVDRRYYCFGCGKTGDVIDFVSEYFNLSLKASAFKLAFDFGISKVDISKPCTVRTQVSDTLDRKASADDVLNELCDLAVDLLFNYRDHWIMVRDNNIPVGESEWTDDFITSIENISRAEIMLDILLSGSLPDREELIRVLTERTGGGADE
jgi:hypothetical protein